MDDDLVVLHRNDILHHISNMLKDDASWPKELLQEFGEWIDLHEVELPVPTTEQLIAELRSRAVYPEVMDSLVLDAVEYKE